MFEAVAQGLSHIRQVEWRVIGGPPHRTQDGDLFNPMARDWWETVETYLPGPRVITFALLEPDHRLKFRDYLEGHSPNPISRAAFKFSSRAYFQPSKRFTTIAASAILGAMATWQREKNLARPGDPAHR